MPNLQFGRNKYLSKSFILKAFWAEEKNRHGAKNHQSRPGY
ncbi:Uncharacterized protein dnm_032180 [Desulfonema magnum]|uniref:Uncharacterized protein n=1 Tax=Desulfonema magnum TaxID=45655 RepID=A0A975BKP9_9BACT|nr:Uncharacterized protein dnm_032180 [Desulfonema magnum]